MERPKQHRYDNKQAGRCERERGELMAAATSLATLAAAATISRTPLDNIEKEETVDVDEEWNEVFDDHNDYEAKYEDMDEVDDDDGAPMGNQSGQVLRNLAIRS
ncbi:hypothetical protein IWX90DRAFT_487512 [Phyllosticta citrichinensis]|uniref:Uncharacterized protein n=1 Tax=Phyllosticta citrichinensis TaxID=1130410 RepID=A0ABR1XRL9_9PEZI